MSAEPIPLPATVRPVRWRDVWSLDPHQPGLPEAVRGAQLHLVEMDASDSPYRHRLGRAVAGLPDDAHLVGGYATEGGLSRRLRFLFASKEDQ
ncbi:hypothetical protein FRAHR75_770015 [Frankia sp. Hr75.2]|nr:hypothetical protein FRAHR75_770015 [Frankia sp. Hr75.2]